MAGNTPIAYLSYGIAGKSFESSVKDAMTQVKESLKNTWLLLDPARHGVSWLDKSLSEFVVHQDLHDIKRCDVVLAFFSSPSFGQSCEMWHAHHADKTVIVVSKGPPVYWSMWMYHTTDIWCSNVDAAIKLMDGVANMPLQNKTKIMAITAKIEGAEPLTISTSMQHSEIHDFNT